MAEHASTMNVATFAELASTPGDKPFAFCIENSCLYFWNPTTEEWVEFLNGEAVTQELADAIATAVERANHTGTQLASTISDFAATALAARTDPSALGYATGAGGTVTQATSKSTGVTLNKLCGRITMHNAALAAGAIVSFTLTNSMIAVNDILVLNHVATATVGPYLLNVQPANGSAVINVRNTSAGSLSNAIVIGFVVIKGVIS